jgi:osmoprotectant transport system permease protein
MNFPARVGLLLSLGIGLLAAAPGCARRQSAGDPPLVRVGSKKFTESVVLGELLRFLATDAGARAEHVSNLADTLVAWNKLRTGAIDAYCEYTGTITEEIWPERKLQNEEAIRQALATEGLRMSRSLGFRDNYAFGMRRERAEELKIRTISDLRDHPELRLGLSIPFLERKDGWLRVRQVYDLPFKTPNGKEHDLLYTEVEAGRVDVMDLYTTDFKIRKLDLIALEDDRHCFPEYKAVILYRADLEERAPEVVRSLLRLEGAISEEAMIRMNGRVEQDRLSDAQAAAEFMGERFGRSVDAGDDNLAGRLLRRTGEHLMLVAVSLAMAIAVAVPLGVAAAKQPALGQVILGAAGVVQTVPSLALLVLLILALPGTGDWVPAVVALFLYSLLPIVRNTYAGLSDIPLTVRESAEALGLSPFARLHLIELPLASRSILAGIKTAAVINVGTATLGGLVGAGGYGQTIFAGISKSNEKLIMEGAIPAVVLALVVQGLFELAERFVVPRGLRLRPAE